jgi:hypothetical protein
MILDFFMEVIFYNVGYFFLRGFTLGRYPKKYKSSEGNSFVEFIGALVTIIIIIVAGYIFL